MKGGSKSGTHHLWPDCPLSKRSVAITHVNFDTLLKGPCAPRPDACPLVPLRDQSEWSAVLQTGQRLATIGLISMHGSSPEYSVPSLCTDASLWSMPLIPHLAHLLNTLPRSYRFSFSTNCALIKSQTAHFRAAVSPTLSFHDKDKPL